MYIACIVLTAIAVAVFMLCGDSTVDEPRYRDKAVGVWFREYAYGSNPPTPSGTIAVLRDGRKVNFLFPVGTVGFSTGPGGITNLTQIVRFEHVPARGDPALEALKELGSNAVPYLTSKLGVGLLDSSYERVFTNLPSSFQRSIPDPIQKRFYRFRAIHVLGELGTKADAATPALLNLLTQSDPSLRRAAIHSLNRIHPNRKEVGVVLFTLGSKGRFADAIEIGQQTDWEGEEAVRLFASLLKSPDVSMRRNAIALIEHKDVGARPALPELIEAINDSDSEVRYMAVRAVEAIGDRSPRTIKALRMSLQDTNVMVQNASRRALSKIAP